MDVKGYTVFEARWEDPTIYDGAQWTRAYDGDFAVLNSRFGPLPRNPSLVPQLERIRVEADERSERGLRAGDLIRVEYENGSTAWWIYEAIPPIGGFEHVTRTDYLDIIQASLT